MYQKITLTLPENVIDKLYTLIPKGQRSEFIATQIDTILNEYAINTKLRKTKRAFGLINDFAVKNIDKSISTKDTLNLINKGRK